VCSLATQSWVAAQGGLGVARTMVAYRAGGQHVEVAGVFAGGADLGGAEDGWGVTTDEAEWGVMRCRLVHTYRCLP
jgi:hypothetical protein